MVDMLLYIQDGINKNEHISNSTFTKVTAADGSIVLPSSQETTSSYPQSPRQTGPYPLPPFKFSQNDYVQQQCLTCFRLFDQ